MHYEETLLLRAPGTFSAPTSRTLTAGRPALQGHPTRTFYQAALHAGATKPHPGGDTTSTLYENDGRCPLRLLGEPWLNRHAARVSDPVV